MRRRAFLTSVAGSLGGLVGLAPWRKASASAPERASVPALPDVPASLLGGERAIIYSVGRQRVWAVNADFSLVKTHLVSGRLGNPPPGNYRVYSKSPTSYSTKNTAVQWKYMVRFYKTPRGNNIGFHQIPVKCKDGKCKPIQSESQLGTPRSSGCVRQKASDAKWLYGWANIGTLVVVTR